MERRIEGSSHGPQFSIPTVGLLITRNFRLLAEGQATEGPSAVGEWAEAARVARDSPARLRLEQGLDGPLDQRALRGVRLLRELRQFYPQRLGKDDRAVHPLRSFGCHLSSSRRGGWDRRGMLLRSAIH